MEVDRIYNVDCCQFIKTLPDKSIDCIYTDIPYLLVKQSNKGNSEIDQKKRKQVAQLKNANIVDGIDYKILDDFIRVLKKVNCFIWCSKLQIPHILNYFLGLGREIYFEVLVWCKTNAIPAAHGIWRPDIEYCLYFKESGILLNDELKNKSHYYISGTNKKDKSFFGHPTIKPLELVKRHLLHATQENNVIFDPFIGSGTTAIASRETGRRYLGCEINKSFYETAIMRLKGIEDPGQQTIEDILKENEKEITIC